MELSSRKLLNLSCIRSEDVRQAGKVSVEVGGVIDGDDLFSQ